jgi:hypothetical protein
MVEMRRVRFCCCAFVNLSLVALRIAVLLFAPLGDAHAENPQLEAFNSRWLENENLDKPSARRLQQLYEVYARLSNAERAEAYPPVSDRIAKFESDLSASRERVENFAKRHSEALEADDEAFIAYGDLTALDKILYRNIASEEAFGVACRVERYLSIQVQTELRKCRDPAIPIPINGVWDQNTFRAASAFFEDAKYWEWTSTDIELVFPSFVLLELIRKVRAEGYGGICRTNPAFDAPKIDVDAACDRLFAQRR